MCKAKGWIIGRLMSRAMGLVTLGVVVSLSGCMDPMAQGIAIGIGASAGAEETQKLARESKTALIAEVLRLRQEVEAAPTPEEKAILQAKLAEAEHKQEIAALTEQISNTVAEGLKKDWTSNEPATQSENWAWIAGLAATVLYGGKKTLDDRAKGKAIAAVKINAKPEEERKIYQALNQGA